MKRQILTAIIAALLLLAPAAYAAPEGSVIGGGVRNGDSGGTAPVAGCENGNTGGDLSAAGDDNGGMPAAHSPGNKPGCGASAGGGIVPVEPAPAPPAGGNGNGSGNPFGTSTPGNIPSAGTPTSTTVSGGSSSGSWTCTDAMRAQGICGSGNGNGGANAAAACAGNPNPVQCVQCLNFPTSAGCSGSGAAGGR